MMRWLVFLFALYTAWHVTVGGVRTELLHGDYVVGDLVLPTVS